MPKAQKTKAKQVVVDTTPVEVTKASKLDLAKAMAQNFEPDTTKSQMIREMHAAGHDKADIAKALGILYQHVRNVLITPLKRPVADKLAK